MRAIRVSYHEKMSKSIIIEIILQVVTALGTIVAIGTLAYQMHKDRDSKKWEQASKVCCWIGAGAADVHIPVDCTWPVSIVISNGSNQPIYDAKITIQAVVVDHINDSRADEYEYVQCIPPGEYCLIKDWPYYGMNKTFNAAISFRDASGNYWIRNGTGFLTEDKSDKSKRLMLPETETYIERIR